MSPRARIEFVPTIHDGLRVTFGHAGEKGTLFFCKRRFWKVRMDAGDWRWPDGIVIDSTGAHVSVCQECELEFRSDKPREVFCAQCEQRMDAADARDPRTAQQFERLGRRPRVRHGNEPPR